MSGGVLFKHDIKQLKNFRITHPSTLILVDVPEGITTPAFEFENDNTGVYDLGSYTNDTEVYIPQNIIDPDGIVVNFINHSGELPPGLSLNTFDGSISGTLTNTSTQTYIFTLVIETVYGNTTAQEYSITALFETQTVVWETGENLGEFDVGQPVNEELVADSQTTT